MASNTTRLGLLKKNPETDGNHTFNIETMLNENWDKIDNRVALLDPETNKVPASQLDVVSPPDASTTVKGIAKLNSSTNSTSETEAATPKAVKTAYDLANGHNNSTTGIHGATPAATANRLLIRDASGRAKVAAPSADDDIALLGTVKQLIANLVNGSPGALDTLDELAQALGDDPNFATTITNLIGTKETPAGAQAKATQAKDDAINWAKGFGLGLTNAGISSTDLNNLDRTGFYMGSGMTNAPTTGTSDWYYVINQKHNDTYRTQIVIRLNATGSNLIFHRTQHAGTWTVWQQIETTAGAQARVNALKTDIEENYPTKAYIEENYTTSEDFGYSREVPTEGGANIPAGVAVRLNVQGKVEQPSGEKENLFMSDIAAEAGEEYVGNSDPFTFLKGGKIAISGRLRTDGGTTTNWRFKARMMDEFGKVREGPLTANTKQVLDYSYKIYAISETRFLFLGGYGTQISSYNAPYSVDLYEVNPDDLTIRKVANYSNPSGGMGGSRMGGIAAIDDVNFVISEPSTKKFRLIHLNESTGTFQSFTPVDMGYSYTFAGETEMLPMSGNMFAFFYQYSGISTIVGKVNLETGAITKGPYQQLTSVATGASLLVNKINDNTFVATDAQNLTNIVRVDKSALTSSVVGTLSSNLIGTIETEDPEVFFGFYQSNGTSTLRITKYKFTNTDLQSLAEITTADTLIYRTWQSTGRILFHKSKGKDRVISILGESTANRKLLRVVFLSTYGDQSLYGVNEDTINGISQTKLAGITNVFTGLEPGKYYSSYNGFLEKTLPSDPYRIGKAISENEMMMLSI